MRIEVDDLSRPDVQALLAEHLADMHATSPAESVHALDVTGLQAPDVSVWSLWDTVPTSGRSQVLGVAALKALSPTDGEVKSMRTSARARGRGVATTLLEHVITSARERGYRRISLETGTQDFFAPARRLYVRHGFAECAPFGEYVLDSNSVFYTLDLLDT